MKFPVSFTKGEASRYLVAAALIAPSLVAILLPNSLFLLGLVLVVGAFTWWEFFVNLLGRERSGLFVLALIGWALTAVGALFYGTEGQEAGLLLALALGAIYFMVHLPPQPDKVSVNLISRYALGHLYISFLLSFVLLIKKLDNGHLWLIFVILVTSAADTGAYYAGSKLKGPKLYPKISPNKTISGLVGGSFLALLVGWVSNGYLPAEYPTSSLLLLSLFLSLWGALGDLFESALKRAMGIKDASNILKGHGGFWDRLDSLLFNLGPVYFFLAWWTQP
jgi:phosphatidate cytidylyltransferase